MTTDLASFTSSAEPQVERSRSGSFTDAITLRSRPITETVKALAERLGTDHVTNHTAAFTQPCVPLGTGCGHNNSCATREKKRDKEQNRRRIIEETTTNMPWSTFALWFFAPVAYLLVRLALRHAAFGAWVARPRPNWSEEGKT